MPFNFNFRNSKKGDLYNFVIIIGPRHHKAYVNQVLEELKDKRIKNRDFRYKVIGDGEEYIKPKKIKKELKGKVADNTVFAIWGDVNQEIIDKIGNLIKKPSPDINKCPSINLFGAKYPEFNIPEGFLFVSLGGTYFKTNTSMNLEAIVNFIASKEEGPLSYITKQIITSPETLYIRYKDDTRELLKPMLEFYESTYVTDYISRHIRKNIATVVTLFSRNEKTTSVEILRKYNEVNKKEFGKDVIQEYLNKTLFIAALRDNQHLLEKCILANADVQYTTQSGGITPLFAASEAGNINIVKQLLEKNADGDALCGPHEVTAAYIAVQNGHIDVVEALLDHVFFYNTITPSNATPGAIIEESKESYKININKKIGKFQVTILYLAAQNGYDDIVDLLLNKGADPNIECYATPLCIASHKGHKKIVNSLLKKDANPNLIGYNGTIPVCSAARSGHPEIVSALLVCGSKSLGFATSLCHANLKSCYFIVKNKASSLLDTIDRRSKNISSESMKARLIDKSDKNELFTSKVYSQEISYGTLNLRKF